VLFEDAQVVLHILPDPLRGNIRGVPGYVVVVWARRQDADARDGIVTIAVSNVSSRRI